MQDKDLVDNRRADHDVGNANDKQKHSKHPESNATRVPRRKKNKLKNTEPQDKEEINHWEK